MYFMTISVYLIVKSWNYRSESHQEYFFHQMIVPPLPLICNLFTTWILKNLSIQQKIIDYMNHILATFLYDFFEVIFWVVKRGQMSVRKKFYLVTRYLRTSFYYQFFSSNQCLPSFIFLTNFLNKSDQFWQLFETIFLN